MSLTAPNHARLRSTSRWNAILGLTLAIVLVARGVMIVNALRSAEPVATSFDEDAYYAFAVARNVAAGNGITAAHGEPTSGFQPLWTLLLVPAFALFGDGRAVLAAIFVLCAAVWLVAARLFAGLMTRHTASSEASLGGLAGLMCLIAFVCDPRLEQIFFGGIETGFYAMALLFLCRWLDVRQPLDPRTSWHQCVAFGLSLGLLLLTRNDAVLIIPFVLLAAAHPDQRTLQRLAVAAGVAAVIFSPWVAYSCRLTGTMVPQGGLATSVAANDSALDWLRVSAAARALLELTVPPLVPRAATMPSWLLAICAVVLCVGFTRLCRHNVQAKRMVRSTAWLAAGTAALVVYYPLFSRATWMYPRYFMCIRLLALAAWLWLVLDALGKLRAWRSRFVAAFLLAAVAISMARAVRSFGASPRFMGEELRLLIATGLCDGPARVGMYDSGRNSYRCAPYVFNLDGKASLAAMNAAADGRVLAHLAAFQIDRLFLRDDRVVWFDRWHPRWRRQFAPVTSANGMALFARVAHEPEAADR